MTKKQMAEASKQIRRFVDAETCRKVPVVALVEAIRAVVNGASPEGVAESLREAAASR